MEGWFPSAACKRCIQGLNFGLGSRWKQDRTGLSWLCGHLSLGSQKKYIVITPLGRPFKVQNILCNMWLNIICLIFLGYVPARENIKSFSYCGFSNSVLNPNNFFSNHVKVRKHYLSESPENLISNSWSKNPVVVVLIFAHKLVWDSSWENSRKWILGLSLLQVTERIPLTRWENHQGSPSPDTNRKIWPPEVPFRHRDMSQNARWTPSNYAHSGKYL